jgi:uncharacterized membrane protein YvbJ
MAYCTQCGTALQDSFKFCPSCGAATNGGTVQETTSQLQAPPTEEEFTSNMLLGGNVITPDRLIVGTTSVIYRKRNKYLIGVDESSIPYRQISSVEIVRHLIDADIIIYGSGNKKIEAKDFSVSNAKRIKQLIEDRL